MQQLHFRENKFKLICRTKTIQYFSIIKTINDINTENEAATVPEKTFENSTLIKNRDEIQFFGQM